MKRILIMSAFTLAGWFIVGQLQIAFLGEKQTFLADMITVLPMVFLVSVAEAIIRGNS